MLGREITNQALGAEPHQVDAAERFVQVDCNRQLCWSVTESGDILSWGSPMAREDSDPVRLGAVEKPHGEVVASVSVLDYEEESADLEGSDNFYFAIAQGGSGSLYGWSLSLPTKAVELLSEVELIATKGPYFMAARMDGSVYSWGYLPSQSSYLGRGGSHLEPLPVILASENLGTVQHMLCGNHYGIVVVQKAGQQHLISWGSQLENTILPSSQLAQSMLGRTTDLFDGQQVIALDGNEFVVVVLVEGGEMYSILLLPGTQSMETPLSFTRLGGAITGRNVNLISVGRFVIIASDSDGVVWVWPSPQQDDDTFQENSVAVSVNNDMGLPSVVYSNYYEYVALVPPAVRVYPSQTFANLTGASQCTGEGLPDDCCIPNSFKCGQISSAVNKYKMEGTIFLLEEGDHVSPEVIPITATGNQIIGAGSAVTSLDCQQHTCFDISAASLVLQGLQLLNGSAVEGGCLFVPAQVDVRLLDVKIHDCSAKRGAGLASLGSVHLEQCSLYNNTAIESGGAIYTMGGDLSLVESDATGNSAASGGAAFFGHTTVDWSSVLIANNFASERGGGIHCSHIDLTLLNSEISQNDAGSNSGGLYLRETVANLNNVTVSSNSAGKLAGGIMVEFSAAAVQDSTFAMNTVGETVSSGNGGAVYCQGDQPMTFINTVFAGNTAGHSGAGIFSQSCSPSIVGCTFESNAATVGGGVALSAGAGLTVQETVFVDNYAGGLGGGLAILNTEAAALVQDCHFEGNHAGLEGGALYVEGSSELLQSRVVYNINSAQSGGGVFWTDNPPLEDTVSFVNNTAVHGPHRASRAKSLEFSAPFLPEAYIAASGALFTYDVHVTLMDFYEQVVASDSSTTVQMKSSTLGLEFLGASVGVLESGKFAFSSNSSTSIGVTHVPGSFASFYVQASLQFGALATPLYSFVMKECDPGEYLLSTVCVQCLPGRFSSMINAESCEDCPFGKFTVNAGSTQCDLCAVNTHANLTGQTRCELCAEGKSTKGQEGLQFCSDCDPGSAAGEGQDCTACPEGRFSAEAGMHSCEDCEPGKHASGEAAIECVDCGPGTFQPSARQNRCFLCDKGSYSSTYGEVQCNACPVGTYSNETGVTSCLACDIGTAMPSIGATRCSSCQPGEYSASEGSVECTLCSKGRFSTTYARTEDCSLCPPGTITTELGATTCAQCDPGSFNPSNTTEQCIRCKPGEYQFESGQSECLNCASGRYSDTEQALSCNPCERGRFSGEPGQRQCSLCPLGRFVNVTGATECEECAPGTAMPNVGQTGCFPCSPGTFTEFPGQSQCYLCGSGRYSQIDGQQQCTSCEPGRFGDEEGQLDCQVH